MAEMDGERGEGLSYGITHSHFYSASASEQNRDGRQRRGEE